MVLVLAEWRVKFAMQVVFRQDGLGLRRQRAPPAKHGRAPVEFHGGSCQDEQVLSVPAQIPHAQTMQAKEVLAVATIPGTDRLRLQAGPATNLELYDHRPPTQHRPAQTDENPVARYGEALIQRGLQVRVMDGEACAIAGLRLIDDD